MLLRSISENPGRMGSEIASAMYGPNEDETYDLQVYCKDEGKLIAKIDLYMKSIENQFPDLLGFLILIIFLSFGLKPEVMIDDEETSNGTVILSD
jgi:hypothetical protein